MSKYRTEWNDDAEYWGVFILTRQERYWRLTACFPDLAEAQEFIAKREAKDGDSN